MCPRRQRPQSTPLTHSLGCLLPWVADPTPSGVRVRWPQVRSRCPVCEMARPESGQVSPSWASRRCAQWILSRMRLHSGTALRCAARSRSLTNQINSIILLSDVQRVAPRASPVTAPPRRGRPHLYTTTVDDVAGNTMLIVCQVISETAQVFYFINWYSFLHVIVYTCCCKAFCTLPGIIWGIHSINNY